MPTIVIVHGAWLDISGWDKVIPILKAAGHEVIGVNLPGHGKDDTPFGSISLESYTSVVKSAIGARTNVILVGHSMAGIVISEVAEQIPGQIGKLIYIAAFLPRNGESLLALTQTDGDSHVPKYLVIDEKAGSVGLKNEGLQDVFAADAAPEDVAKLVAAYKADPLAPWATPLVLSDNMGRIPKIYIHTINDHAVGYTLQQTMVKNAANVIKTYALPSSHTPFINMPDVLSAIILHEAK